jgi:alkanesulfonate monooxygenase SsuD/methylene tetrahydromethanopterin reductase-like flavin-dependent oxidoreductase (luciferase family)
MRIGLMYGLQAPARFGVRIDQVYQEALEQLSWADGPDTGIDQVWLTEHHFFEDDYCPSPLQIASAIAARTSRLRICVGIAILPMYGHPMRLATDTAVVDNLSGGRFELGVGQGYRADEFAGFGLEPTERLGRYIEGLDILDRALTGERFDYDGKYYRVEGAQLRPAPLQQPYPPLWVGAATPTTRRRAARRGHRLLISLLTDREHTHAQFADYRDALVAAGRNPDEWPTALIREFYVSDTDEQAWEEVKPHLLHTYQHVYAPPAVSLVERMADGRRRQIADPDDPYITSGAFAKDRFIIGSVEHCAREIRRYRDELGVDNLVLRLQHPGEPHEMVVRSMERLTKEVLPLVGAG